MFYLKVKSTIDPLEFTLMTLLYGEHRTFGVAFLKLVKYSQLLLVLIGNFGQD